MMAWSASELQGWANREFPEHFSALPTVGELIFSDWENGAQNSKVKLLHLGRGEWHNNNYDRYARMDKKVYAFMHGVRSNQVKFLIQDMISGVYDISEMGPFFSKNRTDCLSDFHHPFRCLGSRQEPLATAGRLRALIAYYFMVAGHIDLVGGYLAYHREFKAACFWVANGGKRPAYVPHPLFPVNSPYHSTTLATSQSSNSQHNSNSNVVAGTTESSLGVGRTTTPPALANNNVYASSSKLKTDTGNGRNQNHAPLNAVPNINDTARNTIPPQGSATKGVNLKRLLYEAGDEYEKIQETNKRLKSDMDKIRTKECELGAVNDRLTIEITRLRQEVNSEKKQNEKLRQSQYALSNSLADAEKGAKQVEVTAEARFKDVKMELAAKLQKEERKTTQAELERDQEKARADAVEAKLASIQAIFHKTA